MTMTPEQASAFQETFGRLVANVEQVLLGKTFVVRLGFVALFSEGLIGEVGERVEGLAQGPQAPGGRG